MKWNDDAGSERKGGEGGGHWNVMKWNDDAGVVDDERGVGAGTGEGGCRGEQLFQHGGELIQL